METLATWDKAQREGGEHYELQQQENSLKSHLCGLLQLNSGATLFMQK